MEANLSFSGSYTHITVGGYDHDTLRFCGRLHSDPAATIDEYAIRLVNLLSLHGASPAQIEGGILGSVVPVPVSYTHLVLWRLWSGRWDTILAILEF